MKTKEGKLLARLAGLLILMLVFFPLCIAQAEEDNEAVVYRYVVDEMDLSPAAACGIMGNMQAESGFNPGISGYNGYGLCQWTGARASRLHAFAAENNMDSASARAQVAFIHYELQNFFPQVYAYLQSVTNDAEGAYNAAYYFCVHFEIPVNAGSNGVYRGRLASNTYWPQYGETMLYLKAAPGKGGIVLTWTGKVNDKQVIMRSTDPAGKTTGKKTSGSANVSSDILTGKWEKLGTVGKKVRTYTDKTVKKKKKYYYFICTETNYKKYIRKGKEAPGRSNRYEVTSAKTMEDDGCIIELSRKKFTFNGTAKCPKIKVTYNGKKLKQGRDFRVSYQNNRNAGKAAAVITGLGDYTGTVRRAFKIEKAKLAAKAKNITVKLSAGSVKPQLTAKYRWGLKYKLLSVEDRKVARIDQKRVSLILRNAGTTVVRVRIYGDRNHEPVVRKFKLTVKKSGK